MTRGDDEKMQAIDIFRIIAGVILLTISIILLVVNPKKESNRWLSFIMLIGGLSCFFQIVLSFSKYCIGHNMPNNTNQFFLLNLFLVLYYSFCFYLREYGFLMFCIVESNIFSKWKKKLLFILMIPIILMNIFIPWIRANFVICMYDMNKYSDFVILVCKISILWKVPYIIIGNILLFYSYLKLRSPNEKKGRLLICLILTPTSIGGLAIYDIVQGFGLEELSRYFIFPAIIFVCILFFLFTTKYGLLGIKIKIEKHRLESTMKSIASGTDILNHSIKNEAIKISLSAENIKAITKGTDQRIDSNIQVILNSINHLFDMTAKIQENIQDIVLVELVNSTDEVIERSLNASKILFEGKKIKIINEYKSDYVILCDSVYIIEALNNIFKNAVEAMEPGGELRIRVYKYRKQVTVEIKDSGTGIQKETLLHIFDPFFSTKDRKTNFGIGLSFCYNVMQKHGGTLEIESKENVGTAVYLHFPSRKLIKAGHKLPKNEVTYG
jgi:two-component system, sporulation sensor kinase B